MNKLIIIILFLLPFYGFAQVDWENPKGAIKSEEIVIEKDKQLVLPQVSRRFTAITVDPLIIDSLAIGYIPKEIKVDLPKIPIKLRPRPMKTEPLDKTYWGNFKAGYGSYISPYFQADVASKRNDEYAVALHFRHFSSKNGPVDKSNSGLSNTDAFLSGKMFLNKATLGAHIGGKFDSYNLYGYGAVPPAPDPTQPPEQKLQNYTMAINISDNDKNESFYYQLNLGTELFNAKNLVWKESDISADFRTDYTASEVLSLKLLADFHLANQNYIASDTRLYYKVKPIGVYSMDAFDFEVGAGVYGVKDSINNFKHKLYLTPHLVARYNFSSGHIVSAGLEGDVSWNSARTRFNENPYLGGTTVINNNVKPVDVFIEANGKVAPKVDFNLGYHISVYKVFGQYINNATDQSTFNINYDTLTNLIHSVKGQVDFISNKNLLFSVYGKYLMFDFKSIENAYHTPKVDLGFKAKFKLEDTFDAELSFSYLDGIYAFDQVTAAEVKLNSILDLNLSASYKFNSAFSVFVNMQNILGNQYQYYYHYPSKGFQALVGASFTL